MAIETDGEWRPIKVQYTHLSNKKMNSFNIYSQFTQSYKYIIQKVTLNNIDNIFLKNGFSFYKGSALIRH